MIRAHRPPRDRGERMILNNFAAMGRLEELASQPLTAEGVFELHRILVDGTLEDARWAGAFRTADDNVVVELLRSIETAHVPPPAAELPERMARLLAFANGEAPEEWVHPVVRAIILHFMIGYDHPFVDGNGRTARALFYWALLRYGYPLSRFISISAVLRQAPAQYARAYLLTESDDGDLTYFIDHQIGVLLRSVDALETYLRGKVAAAREIESMLRSAGELNHRQVALLTHALRHPGFEYTVRSHQTSHGIVQNTARSDLVRLAEAGLLLHGRRGRAHVFIAPHDLESRLPREGA
jgi:Fic family protein